MGDGDVIFIDSGTTTVHMVDYLSNKKNVKVITNNILVINALISYDGIEIIGIGGKVRNSTLSFASEESLGILESYNIQKAFMAATAVNIKNGAMNSSFEERGIKQKVVQMSEKVYLLVDSTKLGRSAMLTYCTLKDVEAIISDGNNKEYIDMLKKAGVNVF